MITDIIRIKERSIKDCWLAGYQLTINKFFIVKYESYRTLPYVATYYCIDDDAYHLGAYFDNLLRAFKYFETSTDNYSLDPDFEGNLGGKPAITYYRVVRKGWDWDWEDPALSLSELGLLNLLRFQGSIEFGLSLRSLKTLVTGEDLELLVALLGLIQKQLITIDIN